MNKSNCCNNIHSDLQKAISKHADWWNYQIKCRSCMNKDLQENYNLKRAITLMVISKFKQ